MSRKSQYIIKQINSVSQTDSEIVCRIVAFRGYELRQSNNGAYIHKNKIDENTLHERYTFSTNKLSS